MLESSSTGNSTGRLRADFGLSAGGRYVVMHPGAGAPDKCWPLENFIAVSRAVVLPTVFIAGPVEMERGGEGVIADLAREVSLAVCPPLTTLAGLLAGAGAYVGNDSGVSHLAAAVGVPSVVLFGTTRPEHFRPVGARVTVATGYPMASISIDRVVSDVRTMTGHRGA